MSIFTMEHVNHVFASDHSTAVDFVNKVVEDDTTATAKTKAKARMLIQKSDSTQKLGMAMTSWILAHPSEGLKVI